MKMTGTDGTMYPAIFVNPYYKAAMTWRWEINALCHGGFLRFTGEEERV